MLESGELGQSRIGGLDALFARITLAPQLIEEKRALAVDFCETKAGVDSIDELIAEGPEIIREFDRSAWEIEIDNEMNRRQVRRCVISLKTILEHYGRFSDFLGRIRPNFS